MCDNKLERFAPGNPLVYVAGRDHIVSESIQFWLQTEKILAHTFKTGQALLTQTFIEPPACIVMDAIMPDIDGTTVLKALKASASDIPVILLGGDSKIPLVVESIKAGAWDYLEKPFIQRDLMSSVLRAIKLQQHGS